MKSLSGVSAGTVMRLALVLCLLFPGALALPEPQPKSAWVRKARGRKATLDKLKSRGLQERSSKQPRTVCPDTSATSITAPKMNVWGELADRDAADVVGFLFAQPELNLTASENATEWDNTLYAPSYPPWKLEWLTDATPGFW